MGVHRYTGGLALLLFVTLQLSASAPGITQKKLPFMAQLPGCPMYQVGKDIATEEVTLDETLTFLVKPNHPMLIMDIAISEQHRYKATMDASRIELAQCNMNYSNCTTLTEGGSKSSDLVKANQWNFVNVSLVEDTITVKVNNKENVMGRYMSMQSDDQDQSNVKVSILGPSSQQTQKTQQTQQTQQTLPTDYKVYVNLECNETYTPTHETIPQEPDTTDNNNTDSAPFKSCGLYNVQQNNARETVKFEDALTLAVFPSEPALNMNVMVQDDLYKVSIDGTMASLKKCNMDGNDCNMMTEGGAKDSTMFTAEKWNYVTILLTDSEITIQVNERHEVMNKLMVVQPDAEYAEVVILPYGANNTNNDYSVAVNLFCNDTIQPTRKMGTYPPMPTTIPTTTIPTTTIADADMTGKPGEKEAVVDGEKDGDDGDNTLTIVLVILAICLVIICAVLAWYCCKTKRSHDINQHTPLENQQLQN